LGQAAAAAGLTILQRILAYGRKVLRWEQALDAIRDSRRRPHITTARVVRAMVVMLLARLGSLNALGQSRPSGFWPKWLAGPLPSPDTVGRICALMDAEDVRGLLRQCYSRLKRQKALAPPWHGLMALVLDGHESHASFRRHCCGCLQRTLHTKTGDRIQYYHRWVGAQLIGRDQRLLLDIEPMRPGEDEVAAALRLLQRLLARYPRAFEVILGDALYAQSRLFNYAWAQGKQVLVVLKENRPDLLQDARQLFERMPGRVAEADCKQWWDLEGFTTWPEVHAPVRVVRSLETRTVRRQLDGQKDTLASDWFWVTTLSCAQVPTAAVVQLGHARWDIENHAFNELVNRWHADHVYKHQPNAMLVFWLMACVCLNLFMTFYHRNLKAAVRRAASMLAIAARITAELYRGRFAGFAKAPT
jgi:hypothetical protein